MVSLGRNAYQPRGATSAGGDLLVWNQGVEHGYSVAIATRSRGGDWVFPRVDDLVAAPVLFSNAPMPALNAAGYAVVAWFQSLGDVLRISMSERESPSDAFRKARESDVLSPPHTLAMHPCPTIHGSGSAAVGWIQETRDHQWVLMLATRTSDGAWRLPEDLSEAMAHNLPATGKPIAIFTPNGALHLIWTEGDDQLRRVWWRRRTPDGRWQDTLPLSPVDGFAIEPSAVAAERGLVTAWRERLNGVFVIRVRALDQDGAAWHGAATLSAGLDGEAGPPALAVGGPDSTAVVAWRQGDTRVGAVHSATLERAVGPTLDD